MKLIVSLNIIKVMPKINPPASWAKLPTWFRSNLWLRKRKNEFAKRLSTLVFQIQLDVELNISNEAPMKATEKSFIGPIGVQEAKYQYLLVLSQFKRLSPEDKCSARAVLDEFNKDFPQYLPHLES